MKKPFLSCTVLATLVLVLLTGGALGSWRLAALDVRQLV